MARTCFVISPIGQEGTEIRQEADAFLQFLVEPALEKYQFEVIRADRIPRPTVITSDIVRLVQESDLCIIDITNSNPNVFYECGRRHETGRPFIQMMSKSRTSDIPFDVAGIRTLEYDLSTVQKARTSVKELQLFIDDIVKGGFGDKSAGFTMATLGEALDRIDRKLTKLLSTDAPRTPKGPSNMKIDLLISHPSEAFVKMLEEGDFQGAFKLAPRIRAATGDQEYFAALGVLARASYEPACDLLVESARELAVSSPHNEKILSSLAYSIKEYFINSGTASQGVPVMIGILDAMRQAGVASNSSIARYANIVGMMAWSAGDHATGNQYERIAISLAPDVASYVYNNCLTLEKLGLETELVSALKSLAHFNSQDEDHLRLLRKHGFAPQA